MESGHTPSGKYRGSKSAPHEGGHRIPFFVSWPNKIKAGSVSDEVVITHDIMATMAKVVGAELTDEDTLDSMNFLPILMGEKDYNSRDSLIWQAGASFQVMYREDNWKLIIQSSHKLDKWEPVALFDLKSNLVENEKQNKIHNPEYQGKVKSMFNTYMETRKSGVRTAPVNP
jgi:arylsulfatase A-like enzyme